MNEINKVQMEQLKNIKKIVLNAFFFQVFAFILLNLGLCGIGVIVNLFSPFDIINYLLMYLSSTFEISILCFCVSLIEGFIKWARKKGDSK